MPNSSRELLDTAYSRLGFEDGDLLSAEGSPTKSTSRAWVEKGDWLALAKKVGAEKVFFVDTYPVIVFAEQTSPDPAEWIRWFNSVWCMARPQMLFLAREGELSVFNLTKRPARPGEEPSHNQRLLDTVQATAEVEDRLHRYRRDQVESGRLFRDELFQSDDRADRALVRDLGRIRAALIKAELPAAHAHSLIGRSIFIRYLEDRGVLTERYFRKVAKGDEAKWTAALEDADELRAGGSDGRSIYYPKILTNKAFSYALFTQLSKDFNGDMFPVTPKEERAVTDRHLKLLRNFLLGGRDEQLFFFAYRFDIIPIDLISNIYEKFYSINPKKKRDEGSYYTSSALVDFVLSQTLTDDLLAKNPRVLDPACGSGIFLVETFRRIVRYQINAKQRALTPEELRTILRDQIAGVDINPEAVRVAAFSLYLAMLHYLEPPDILHNKLPSLTYAARSKSPPDKFLDILVAEDVFGIEDAVSDETVRKRFSSGCADVIVGNPPWGAAKAEQEESLRSGGGVAIVGNPPWIAANTEQEESLRSDGGVAWCKGRGLSVGYKERSETFTHLTMDLLRDGGRAGLLLSTGVFFKRHQNTRKFRNQWLTKAMLLKVVNFAAVRDAYFQGAAEGRSATRASDASGEGSIAPFAAVIFEKTPPKQEGGFAYWSAKETAFVRHVQAVILNHADLRTVCQSEFLEDDTLWKIYWWGGHRDEVLIKRLRLERTLGQLADPNRDRLGTGFQEAKEGRRKFAWLARLKEFPTKCFARYGPLPKDRFVKPPAEVLFPREERLYQGPRLLIKEGPSSDDIEQGRIVARFETESFCFRYSINSLPLVDISEANAKVLLGIIWSSLTRYLMFMTSGSWGPWHDAIRQETIYSIPARLPKKPALAERIVKIVDSLRMLPDDDEEAGPLFASKGITRTARNTRIKELEAQLDEAVYELFELTEEEKERIREMCSIGLDLFYKGMDSAAVEPLDWPDAVKKIGRRGDLRHKKAAGNELCDYVAVFVDLWEPQLRDQAGRFRWRVVRPQGTATMLAAVFQTETAKEPLEDSKTTDDQAWREVLIRLEQSSRQPTNARRIYIDGLIRIVTDEDIVIIKRNERRLWTPSSARDDAEATMLMAAQLAEEIGGDNG